MTNRNFILILYTHLFISFPILLNAQNIPLTAENWRLFDNANDQTLDLQISDYKGKKALHLGRHETAQLINGDYDNFVLELDMAGKAMPGLGFRAVDVWNYECFYTRVFAGGKQEALQYIPVYNGAHPWQLYNEPIYETKADIQPQEWMHLRIEVYGRSMRVFVDDAPAPQMALQLLQQECKKGTILLKTGFAEAYFSNISVQPLTTAFTVEATASTFNYLDDWQISEQLDGDMHSQRQYYQWLEKAEKQHSWQSIKTDGHGIVNLAQYFEHPQGAVFAKTIISSETEQTVDLVFDFCNVLMITLNNDILYHGRELDTGNFMRLFDGEHRLPISLKAGENKLVFWIRSDDQWQTAVGNPPYLGRHQAMNWGFIARLEK